MSIIDIPYMLSTLNENELNEKLLDDKYNKSNLRELVRRCLYELKQSNMLVSEYHKQVKEEKAKVAVLKDIINNL